MKTKYAMVLLAMGIAATVMAQETDDMYFNSKDRLVVNKTREVVLARQYQDEDRNAVRSNPVNPSDSYSGRGVNPEYGAQVKNGTAIVQDDPAYFTSTYQPKNINNNLYSGSGTYPAGSYGNNYYGNNYGTGYGMGYGGMGMGYGSMGMGYGSMGMGYGMGMGMGYGGFGSPFYSPYSSMSMMSLGYGFGGYNPGFYGGMGYGMSSMYGYGMSPFGYSPFGYGMSYYGGYNTAIVTNGGGAEIPNVAYGRHPSRSSSLNSSSYVDRGRASSGSSVAGYDRGTQTQGGRMNNSAQSSYYDRGWRNNADNFSNRNAFNNSNFGGSRAGMNTGNNNGWGNSGGRSSFDNFGGGSRGASFGGGGGGFSGGGGGGGGSHSRGRN